MTEHGGAASKKKQAGTKAHNSAAMMQQEIAIHANARLAQAATDHEQLLRPAAVLAVQTRI
jgi:hypothetical protein